MNKSISAIPEDFVAKTTELSAEVTRPIPGSKKIYVQGSGATANLKLSKDGTDVLKLSPSGELTVEGNVTAFGSA